MSRKKKFENSHVVSVRFEDDMYNKMREIAALETFTTGTQVHMLDLVRGACDFVYNDNERMRESFRRSRAHINARLNKRLE
jgi:hypothetical protein